MTSEAARETDDVIVEFSRPIQVARIRQTPSIHHIEANEDERRALARRFSLFALERLEATVTLCRQDGDIRFEAELNADIRQPAPSGDDVAENLRDRFVLLYRPGIDEEEADRLTIEDPSDQVIEPLLAPEIDIGEAVAQQLSLAMEPFPEFGDPDLDDGQFGDETGPADALREGNPFSILWSLKKN